MKQSEFLRLLDLHLGDIIQAEKEEILNDYREHFKIALNQGKTEEEICSSIGDPVEMASQYRMNYPIGQSDDKEYRGGNISETLSSVGKGFLNYIGLGEKNIIDEQKSISINDVKNINIKTNVESINLISTDDANLKANLNGYCTSKNESKVPKLILIKAGDTIDIKIYRKISIGINLNIEKVKLDIYVPKAYNSNIFVKTSTGNIGIESLKLNNINCNTSTGNIAIDNSNLNILGCKTSTGHTTINGICNRFEYKSSTGSLTCNNIVSKETVLKSSTGKLTLRGNPGNVESSTSTGKLLLEYNEYDNNITASTGTGSTTIRLPNSAQFYLKYKAGTGKAKCEFPMVIMGIQNNNKLEGTVVSDKNKIMVNSSTGNLNIETLK